MVERWKTVANTTLAGSRRAAENLEQDNCMCVWERTSGGRRRDPVFRGHTARCLTPYCGLAVQGARPPPSPRKVCDPLLLATACLQSALAWPHESRSARGKATARERTGLRDRRKPAEADRIHACEQMRDSRRRDPALSPVASAGAHTAPKPLSLTPFTLRWHDAQPQNALILKLQD